MLGKWQKTLLEWPNWIKMLLLITMTISTLTIVVLTFSWLLDNLI